MKVQNQSLYVEIFRRPVTSLEVLKVLEVLEVVEEVVLEVLKVFDGETRLVKDKDGWR